MSFLEHLEELRSRIIRALIGVAVAFAVSLLFCDRLWDFVRQPATHALETLGINPPNLAQITPMESFNVIWFKLPIMCAIFLSSPWIVYQVWAFISPGLYRRERRFAAPFILCSAGLFILGGVFAYFVAFRFALTFLLGIGLGKGITPVVSVSEYFDLFVNVVLGVGLVFELPVVDFLSDFAQNCHAEILNQSQPLCHLDYFYYRRGGDADTGRVQHDVVRDTDVRAVLRGNSCQLCAGVTPRTQAISLEDEP